MINYDQKILARFYANKYEIHLGVICGVVLIVFYIIGRKAILGY